MIGTMQYALCLLKDRGVLVGYLSLKAKTKFILLVSTLAVVFSIFVHDLPNVKAADDLETAVQCSFTIPAEFVPGNQKGLFVNVNSPMESSTIQYSVYDNGLDKVLTNRERRELEEAGTAAVIDESVNLTKDIYQSRLSAEYNKAYGEEVNFNVSSFTKIRVDGYPGFKIESTYQKSDEEQIHQTVYMIISKYRLFTIAYQRAEDDDCLDAFEASSETIHVR